MSQLSRLFDSLDISAHLTKIQIISLSLFTHVIISTFAFSFFGGGLHHCNSLENKEKVMMFWVSAPLFGLSDRSPPAASSMLRLLCPIRAEWRLPSAGLF